LPYQNNNTMKNNKIKIASTVYPENPLPFNEWIKMVYKNAENNSKSQDTLSIGNPVDFNTWAILIHTVRN